MLCKLKSVSFNERKGTVTQNIFSLKSGPTSCIYQGLFCHDQVSLEFVFGIFQFVMQFTDVFMHHGT